jgi:hypothetical protein
MRLDEIGAIDGWRCWLCDEPVDPEMSVNDPRGPSVDSRTTERRAKAATKKAGGAGKEKGRGTGQERLAHRACNTGKGAVDPVVHWPEDLFIADAAVIIPTVDRLARKGGREVVGRCIDRDDADAAATWLVDRISRLDPELTVTSEIEAGGGQYLVVLRS